MDDRRAENTWTASGRGQRDDINEPGHTFEYHNHSQLLCVFPCAPSALVPLSWNPFIHSPLILYFMSLDQTHCHRGCDRTFPSECEPCQSRVYSVTLTILTAISSFIPYLASLKFKMTTTSRAQFLPEYKLVVIGEEGVGKISLMHQFVYGNCPVEIDPTLDQAYRKQLVVDDELVVVDIYHGTHTNEAFGGLSDHVERVSDGFVLVYSITHRTTFSKIRSYHERIDRIKGQDASAGIIIVANKCDLEARREVSMKEGRDLAKELGCAFMETSARHGLNVEEAFIDVVRHIRRSNNPNPGDRQDGKGEGEAERASRLNSGASKNGTKLDSLKVDDEPFTVVREIRALAKPKV
ncbi:Ras family protein [Mycena sanguinolenta]|uniref:Ras family protein n=1 Tax=Mycena sanguinolenta TaxID=230812 RepID=A0A8H7CXL2_9AGAR|nr:Ras family protein [Mycena sanguinolenta]